MFSDPRLAYRSSSIEGKQLSVKLRYISSVAFLWGALDSYAYDVIAN